MLLLHGFITGKPEIFQVGYYVLDMEVNNDNYSVYRNGIGNNVVNLIKGDNQDC